MRVYELARALGVETEQVKIWAAPNTLGSSSGVPKILEDAIRAKAAAAANNQPDPSQAKAKEGIPREEVQNAIDEIVEEYGTEWCGDGVEGVNGILARLGLNVIRVADYGYLNMRLTFVDLPMVTEDMEYDFNQYLRGELLRRLTGEAFVFKGREFRIADKPGRHPGDGGFHEAVELITDPTSY